MELCGRECPEKASISRGHFSRNLKRNLNEPGSAVPRSVACCGWKVMGVLRWEGKQPIMRAELQVEVRIKVFIDQNMCFIVLPWNALQPELHPDLLSCQLVSANTTPSGCHHCAPSSWVPQIPMINLSLWHVSIAMGVWVLPASLHFLPALAVGSYILASTPPSLEQWVVRVRVLWESPSPLCPALFWENIARMFNP